MIGVLTVNLCCREISRMGESGDSSPASFFKRHWEEYKEFWSDRFSILDNYSKFIKGREQPIPSWSAADVEAFIATDPVHGPPVIYLSHSSVFVFECMCVCVCLFVCCLTPVYMCICRHAF